ncbi:nitroreductase, partial [Streptomyces solincola]
MSHPPTPSPDTALRHALASARSTRVPAAAAPAPAAPVTWTGPPWALRRPSAAHRARVDLDHLLALSLAAPSGSAGRLRPVPSAGALHPVRPHLLVAEGCTLPPGRYAYDATAHRAHLRGPAPAGAPPGATVVLTVTAGPTVAHYGHRGWPLLLLDAGHAAAALALAARGGAYLALDADGGLLAAAAGLPSTGTPPEQPLAAVHLPPGGRALPGDPLSGWAAQPAPDGPVPPGPASPSAALTAARKLLVSLAAGGPTRATWHRAPTLGAVTDRVLQERRSAEPAELARSVPGDLLARVLATAANGPPGGPDWCAAVGGSRPAILAPAQTDRAGLRVLATGDARPTLAHWAAGQRWLADAGAVLVARGCPSDAPGPRIRLDHLAAGCAAGLAHAQAAALGLPSRPVGSWQRADLGAALGDPDGRDWIVHGLALG